MRNGSSSKPASWVLLQIIVLLLISRTHISSSFAAVRRKRPPPRQRRGQESRGLDGGPDDGNRNNLRCRNDKGDDRVAHGETALDRRYFLRGSPYALLGISSSTLLGGFPRLRDGSGVANAATPGDGKDREEQAERLPDPIVRSLTFERVLGSGSYKTVYLVSAAMPALDGAANRDGIGSVRAVRYAMAVERLRNKREVKNAFRGVRIPDFIRLGLSDADRDRELFETIVDWWVQSSNVSEYTRGGRVFPLAETTLDAPTDTDKTLGRTRAEPKKNFVGSRWMVSFKPVYETDLGRFIRNAPVLLPVGKVGVDSHHGGKPPALPSGYWTEPALMAFVLDILHAGRLMHEAGIVHRDIKPKNVMIHGVRSSSGSLLKRPVIIDFGYSELGSPLFLGVRGRRSTTRPDTPRETRDVCVVRPGQLKGEVGYVLAEDLANYRGCHRGDAYAMGKTLYEFIFGSAESQQQSLGDREVISVDGAVIREQKFRNLLFDDATAGNASRFCLSQGAAQCLVSITRGLCGSPKDGLAALSFAEAEAILLNFLSGSPSS